MKRPLWRWGVSVVDFITAAENTENTGLSRADPPYTQNMHAA